MDYRVTALEVAMATAAAPTYFPAYDSKKCITLVDGGIWANNPVALAVVEGISVLGWNGDDLDVLSIGCTEESEISSKKDTEDTFGSTSHPGRDARSVAFSKGIARHLTGRDRGLENVFRINPLCYCKSVLTGRCERHKGSPRIRIRRGTPRSTFD